MRTHVRIYMRDLAFPVFLCLRVPWGRNFRHAVLSISSDTLRPSGGPVRFPAGDTTPRVALVSRAGYTRRQMSSSTAVGHCFRKLVNASRDCDKWLPMIAAITGGGRQDGANGAQEITFQCYDLLEKSGDHFNAVESRRSVRACVSAREQI